ncbi:MAG: hypothetical protein ABSA96_01115 [Candidatus Acidiferrales bacterium]
MLAAPRSDLDVSGILAGIPKGAWVALSNDETKVVAYAAELQVALDKAKEAGEDAPVVLRVPEADAATILL